MSAAQAALPPPNSDTDSARGKGPALPGQLRRSITAWLLHAWDTPHHRVTPQAARSLLHFGSRIYEWGLRRDQAIALSRRRGLPAFVISVGNLTTGGTGKTPFTLWLSTHLGARGITHGILSRGYGRTGRTTRLVPQTGETGPLVTSFGDEPVLMARRACPAKVWVGRDRWDSGMAAIRDSQPRILLLDDGFQHLSLTRDLDLVLLDGHRPFGNGCLLPLGPLREPVAQLARADAFILTRARDPDRVAGTRSHLSQLFPGKPIFCCRHRLTGFSTALGGRSLGVECLMGRKVSAFAGLGYNPGFFQSLLELGIDLVETIHFPDHHPYAGDDLEAIFRKASRKGAHVLVTTEKDWVRLPPQIQGSVLAARLQLDFGEEQEALHRWLDAGLSRLMPHPSR